jgi:hypothetical protein
MKSDIDMEDAPCLNDSVDLTGVIYCVQSDCVIILFRCDGGRQGRVAIPLREFFSRAVESQVTLQ